MQSFAYVRLAGVERFYPVPGAGLAIFRHDSEAYALFYTPGFVVVVPSRNASSFQASLVSDGRFQRERGAGLAELLCRNGRLACTQLDQQRRLTYEPECLTLYLSNRCTLACTYCFANASAIETQLLDLEAVRDAAELVAENCKKKGLPFSIVFHGGGEPTLHRSLIENILSLIDTITARHSLGQFRYIATNGVLASSTANWVAAAFDLVGLSCDGPSHLHDAQRPDANGRATLAAVERTARVLHEANTKFHVRATITPATMSFQEEIAEYICRVLVPDEIHFEPAYAGGRSKDESCFKWEDALIYVDHFLQAKCTAQEHGVSLTQTGTRLGTVHGAYCNVFRQVLTLIPGNKATACFKLSRAEPDDHEKRLLEVGPDGLNTLEGQVRDLRSELQSGPEECESCFNRYHCAGLCPDICLLEQHHFPAFRCMLQKLIAFDSIQRTADKLWLSASGDLAGATVQV